MDKQERGMVFDYLLLKHHGHIVTVTVSKTSVHVGRMSYNPQLCKATVDVFAWEHNKRRTVFVMSFTADAVVKIEVDNSDHLRIRIN